RFSTVSIIEAPMRHLLDHSRKLAVGWYNGHRTQDFVGYGSLELRVDSRVLTKSSWRSPITAASPFANSAVILSRNASRFSWAFRRFASGFWFATSRTQLKIEETAAGFGRQAVVLLARLNVCEANQIPNLGSCGVLAQFTFQADPVQVLRDESN